MLDGATKYLTEAQVRQLMEAAKGRSRSKVNGTRDAAMVYLGRAHRLRVVKLVRLRLAR